MDYARECSRGKAVAANDLAAVRETGNLPLFVRKIREAAKDDSGIGVGFLFAIAGELRR